MNYAENTINEYKVKDSFVEDKTADEILNELGYHVDECYLMCSKHKVDVWKIDLTNK